MTTTFLVGASLAGLALFVAGFWVGAWVMWRGWRA